MDIVKIECGIFNGLHLVMCRVEWWAHSKASINFLIPQTIGFLARLVAENF